MSRRAGWLAAACGAMLAAPFWVGSFVPLVDLPQHLAVASVIANHGDPWFGFARYYDVERFALTPYWTYYLALDALAQVMPLDAASRVCLSLYAVAVPFTGLALCSAFGAPRWAGLLMAPLAFNSNLYLGFVAYVCGVLLALFLLAQLQRLLDRPSPRRAVAMAALSVVLFFTHVQPFALLVASALLLALLAPERVGVRRRLGSLLVFAPAVALVFLPWIYREFLAPRTAGGEYNFGTLDDLRPRHLPPGQRLADFAPSVAGAYLDGSDTLLLAAWAGVVAALLAMSWRRGSTAPARRGIPLALLAVLLYSTLPMAIQGQWNIGPRFAWVAALLIVPAIGDPGPVASRWAPVLAVVLTVAASLNAWRQHRRFDHESRAFAGVLAAIPPAQRVVSLVYDPHSRVFTRWPYLHFVQYVTAFRGGAASWTLAKSPPFPIRHRDAGALPTVPPFEPERFRVAEHGHAYDYVVARAGPEARRIFAGAPQVPEAVFEGGGWRVWRNPSADAAR